MGRIKKKGTQGAAKNYISRTQAVRKLQISLPDFRRIYPREPRNKKRVSKSSTPSTTFYYSRDIQYLLHEPLLAKFRDHKALGKKIARHLGRGETGDAQRLEKKGTTKLSLDHIVKERYPTFADALRDLDDALTLLFLFANLPSTSMVPPKTIASCQRLCLEFQHYVITSNSLRKSFLSIRGIYYQATIQGQDILWLVPYRFVQRVTGDVDFRIMGTFVEFYQTLLGFVNFRLYTTVGLRYPPKFDAKSDEQGGELDALTLEGRAVEEDQQQQQTVGPPNEEPKAPPALNEALQKRIAAISELPDTDEATPEPSKEPPNDTIDTFSPTAKDADILPQPQASSNEAASLFAPYTFFLSRETPRAPLEFILRAFGCKRIGWDPILGDGAYTNYETDPSITHQVVDRPPVTTLPEDHTTNDEEAPSTTVVKPGYRVPGRIYIQPQWIWDCINEMKLLRPDLYAPGATLPPHLSPFVKPGAKGAYDPRASLAEQEREGEAEEAEGLSDEDSDSDSEDGSEIEPTETNGVSLSERDSSPTKNDPHGMTIAASESDSDSDSNPSSFAAFSEDEAQPDDQEPAAAADDDNDDNPTQSLHQAELEAEATGLPFTPSTSTNPPTLFPKSILKPSKPSKHTTASNPARKAGDAIRKQAQKKRKEAEEELERRMIMAPGRKRKLYQKMKFGNEKVDGEAERLRGKRRRLENKGR